MARPINRKGRPVPPRKASETYDGTMSAEDKARLDSLWGSSLLSPPAPPVGSDASPVVTSLNLPGTSGDSEEFSRADHVHTILHGDLEGGTLHDEATTGTAGFMSSQDKTRLDTLWNNPVSSSGGFNPYVWHESPAGVRNGINTVFSLTQSPVPTSSLSLFRNGLLLKPGASEDYTLSGKTIPFTSPSTPTGSDILRANYVIGITLYLHVFGESPSGALNGTNQVFTVVYSPRPTTSLQVFKNGMFQRPGALNDYTLSGTTITFTSPSTPTSLDVLQVFYTRGVNSF